MNQLIQFIREILPILVILSQGLFIFLLLSFFLQNQKLKNFISSYALATAFIISLTATLGSLFYSEILGWEPCKFCWFQRIFMYPQVLILGISIFIKDDKVWRYVIPLSAIGGLISLNHYILQTTGSSIIPCSALGQSVSCSKVFVMNYGYITIPLMATTAFATIILLMLHLKKKTA